jgi:hypothetical protein
MYDEQFWKDYGERTPQTEQEQLDAMEQAENRPARASAAQMAEAMQNIDVIMSNEFWGTCQYYDADLVVHYLEDVRYRVENLFKHRMAEHEEEMGDGLEV